VAEARTNPLKKYIDFIKETTKGEKSKDLVREAFLERVGELINKSYKIFLRSKSVVFDRGF
jgi:hypothetical protein